LPGVQKKRGSWFDSDENAQIEAISFLQKATGSVFSMNAIFNYKHFLK
jgi:hypothetical protein